MTVHINARFLTQTTSGVQRFARGWLGALDARLASDPALAARLGPMRAWVPAGRPIQEDPGWSQITLSPLPGAKGHIWEQTVLARQVGSDPLLSLCGSGPLACRNQLLVLHDANIWTNPHAFSPAYRWFHRPMRAQLAHRVRSLATVSAYSAQTLAAHLCVPTDRFHLLSNSADHITAVTPDPDALHRHGLTHGRFMLTVGNMTPNKNLARMVQAVHRLPDDAPILAVAGTAATGMRNDPLSGSDRVRPLGRLEDTDLAALYRGAAGFVWPALSEGFGIPPLEAMAMGVPVLSSDRTAMPEVLGDAPLYFDPENVEDITRALKRLITMPEAERAAMVRKGHTRANCYSWAAGVDALVEIIADLQTTAATTERSWQQIRPYAVPSN
ncbi:MAG: glycosyltransferase family 4 protein [Paracoccaceae bacterium]